MQEEVSSWKRPPTVAPSRCCLAMRYTHVTSPALMTRSEASSPALDGYASTSPIVGIQWSHDPSSSSWASSSPLSLTSSSLTPPPVAPTTWWSSFSLLMPSASLTSASLPMSTTINAERGVISSSTETLLSSRVLYARSFSRVDDEIRSFRSCLRWMCVEQSDGRHAMVSRSLFLLLGVFAPIISPTPSSIVPTTWWSSSPSPMKDPKEVETLAKGSGSPSKCSWFVFQGLFEGLKAYKKEDGSILLFRPHENALRMRMGAERMCMPSPAVEQFVDAVKLTVLANKRWVVLTLLSSFKFKHIYMEYKTRKLL
ncbi:hypothetical protein GW17_00033353 [Ensete ventricosum]|nr:hypothetical protein GW17_00033353 [Ensete ventricosum]